jgi:hypothetical protein
MSFIERKIDVTIQLDGDTFDGGGNMVQLSGLRCQATILNYTGTSGSFAYQLQMRISGMLPADMAKLSTMGFSYGSYKKNLIQIRAGDDISGMPVVFTGSIYSAVIDYNAMPDVGVEILAFANLNQKFMKASATSYKGAMDVATMIQSICAQAGLKFINNGVTTKLSNHAVGGNYMAQIADICHAAGCYCNQSLDGSTITIFPKGGTVDDSVIVASPTTGMVGYPMYNGHGITVVIEFNSTAQAGRRVRVDTAIPQFTPAAIQKFSGNMADNKTDFFINTVTHNLSSQAVNGPWFTSIEASETKYRAV